MKMGINEVEKGEKETMENGKKEREKGRSKTE